MANKNKTLYNISEASKYLKVTRPTIYSWINKGRLYTIEIGGVKFIPLEALQNIKSR